MNREKEIYKVTLVGSAGNVALLTFKFIAGIMGHSSAMIADAVHSLSDFITDVVVLAFVHVSAKPQDVGHDYGHGKYETFASFIIGLALLAAATGIIVSGVAKLIDWAGGKELAAPGWLALAAAIISITSCCCQCLAPSQRRLVVHRNYGGHRRSHPAGKPLDGA